MLAGGMKLLSITVYSIFILPHEQTMAEVMQENSKLHSEIGGIQKLNSLLKQKGVTLAEGNHVD